MPARRIFEPGRSPRRDIPGLPTVVRKYVAVQLVERGSRAEGRLFLSLWVLWHGSRADFSGNCLRPVHCSSQASPVPLKVFSLGRPGFI